MDTYHKFFSQLSANERTLLAMQLNSTNPKGAIAEWDSKSSSNGMDASYITRIKAAAAAANLSNKVDVLFEDRQVKLAPAATPKLTPMNTVDSQPTKPKAPILPQSAETKAQVPIAPQQPKHPAPAAKAKAKPVVKPSGNAPKLQSGAKKPAAPTMNANSFMDKQQNVAELFNNANMPAGSKPKLNKEYFTWREQQNPLNIFDDKRSSNFQKDHEIVQKLIQKTSELIADKTETFNILYIKEECIFGFNLIRTTLEGLPEGWESLNCVEGASVSVQRCLAFFVRYLLRGSDALHGAEIKQGFDSYRVGNEEVLAYLKASHEAFKASFGEEAFQYLGIDDVYITFKQFDWFGISVGSSSMRGFYPNQAQVHPVVLFADAADKLIQVIAATGGDVARFYEQAYKACYDLAVMERVKTHNERAKALSDMQVQTGTTKVKMLANLTNLKEAAQKVAAEAEKNIRHAMKGKS